jgi:PrtD family type I secretion system ABC transporter
MRPHSQATRLFGYLRKAPRTELQEAMRHCHSALGTVVAFSMIINVLMIASPIYMLQVYDRVLSTGRMETLAALTLIVGSALFIMCAIDSLRTAITVRIGAWLNNQLGPVYLASSMRAQLKGKGPGAQPLRDLTQLQGFIATQGLSAFFDFPWVPVFVAIIWCLHPLLGTVALVAAIALLLLSIANDAITRRPLLEANQAQIRATQFADTAIRNAEVVWAMGMLPAMIERWRASNNVAVEALRGASERSGKLVATTKFMRLFVQIAILGVGAILVLRSELTAGGMIAASILLSRALAPVELAMTAWRGLTSARIAYGRLRAQIEAFPTEPDRIRLPAPQGRIAVENLTFAAPGTGQAILRQVSFAVEPGEILAVIGPSAAGKSTLCRSIVGIAEPTSGKVRLDGSEIEHWDHDQLGRFVGFLPQDVELFAGTVRENIARMGAADDEAVVEAARLAHAHEMIQLLRQGYDTEIGEGGARLSGGQKQRLGLARAVFGDPRLIVLDEPNSNLDQAGEVALASALTALKQRGAAIIVVGHRPSTLAMADKVLLLKEGRTDLFGPRDQVLQTLREGSSQGRRPPSFPMQRHAQHANGNAEQNQRGVGVP